MDRIFSTADVHQRDRFDYWHDVACATIVDHDASPERRSHFAADISAGAIGDVEVILFRNSPMSVLHGARHVGHTRDDQVFLCKQMAGELRWEQDARHCMLTPGSFALLDPRLEYEGSFSGDSQLLVCKLPRRDLESRLGRTRELVARAITSSTDDEVLLASFLSKLAEHCGKMSIPIAQLLENLTLDLAAVIFAKKLQRPPRVSSSRVLMRLNIRAFVESNLRDPKLDAAMIATLSRTSLRYANSVLADEGTSLSRLILERRLERCHAALGDPAQTHRSISDIAFGWGFSDMTHFGRSFKKRYGMLPRDFRKSR